MRKPGVSDPNYSIETARLWENARLDRVGSFWPCFDVVSYEGILFEESVIAVWTDPPLYTWLKFSRKVLLHVLSRDPDSKVSLLTLDDVRFYQASIGEQYHLCADVWGAADGLKLLIQSTEDEAKQNKNYNG